MSDTPESDRAAAEGCYLMPGDDPAKKHIVHVSVAQRLERERDVARRENDILRGVLSRAALPCVYCGLEDMAKCASGFPGCARADDMICGGEEVAMRMAMQNRSMRKCLESILERDLLVRREMAKTNPEDHPGMLVMNSEIKQIKESLR